MLLALKEVEDLLNYPIFNHNGELTHQVELPLLVDGFIIVRIIRRYGFM